MAKTKFNTVIKKVNIIDLLSTLKPSKRKEHL